MHLVGFNKLGKFAVLYSPTQLRGIRFDLADLYLAHCTAVGCAINSYSYFCWR